MWESIQYVTSGLTLAAFIAAAIAWVSKSKIEERERLINSADSDKRADLVKSALEFFDVDIAGLTKDDRYKVVIAQIHARSRRNGTVAIVVCFLALLLAGVSVYAISEARKPTSSTATAIGKERRFVSTATSPLSLSNTTEWHYPEDTVRLSGVIATNGNALNIRARRLIAEDATLQGLAQSAEKGAAGRAGTLGATGTGVGQAGASGENGAEGAIGARGAPHGSIQLEVDEMTGSLAILSSGQTGGSGGTGGQGGNGGGGAKGEASRPGLIDCASGPGHGGRGGDGGNGGRGGDGADGGAAGDVRLKVVKSFAGSVFVTAKGGVGGAAGQGGAAGAPGAGGAEGDARGRCNPAGRQGASGAAGSRGSVGQPGAAGAHGRIAVDLPSVSTTVIGEFRYQNN